LTRARDGDGRVDQWGVAFDRRPAFWLSWIWAGGGDVLCADGRRASGCLDAPATIAALRWYRDLVTRWGVAPPPHDQGTAGVEIARLFAAGRVAFMTVGPDGVRDLRASVAAGRLRVGFAPIPHRAGVPPATVLVATGYAVPARTLRRRAAVELAADLTDSLAGAARWAMSIPRGRRAQPPASSTGSWEPRVDCTGAVARWRAPRDGRGRPAAARPGHAGAERLRAHARGAQRDDHGRVPHDRDPRRATGGGRV